VPAVKDWFAVAASIRLAEGGLLSGIRHFSKISKFGFWASGASQSARNTCPRTAPGGGRGNTSPPDHSPARNLLGSLFCFNIGHGQMIARTASRISDFQYAVN